MKPIVLDWLRQAIEQRLHLGERELSPEECELIVLVLNGILLDARRMGR